MSILKGSKIKDIQVVLVVKKALTQLIGRYAANVVGLSVNVMLVVVLGKDIHIIHNKIMGVLLPGAPDFVALFSNSIS